MIDAQAGISRRNLMAWTGVAAAGASLPAKSAFGQTGKPVTILQASSSFLISWAPSFLAEELGYYKDAGLSVERISNTNGPGGLTALVSGSGTLLLSAPGELLAAASRGQKMKILMSESNYQASHMVISKEYAAKFGITPDMPSAQKLALARNMKGIRVALSSAGSFTDFNAQAALRGVGLNPATDAELLPLGTVANGIAAMARGRIDALQSSSPAPEMVEAQTGAVVLFSVGKGEVPGFNRLSGHVMMARAADVERDPDLYSAMILADTRALRRIVEDPKGAGELLYKNRYATLAPEVWSVVWKRNLGQFRTPYVTKDSIQAWIDLSLVPNVVNPKAINLDEIVDMRFVEQAVKQIGWQVAAG